MPDDSYRLIDKDKMEPSILLRRLRPWRDEDADRAKPLVHAILDAYGRKEWRCDPFKWETSVCPLFYFAKDRDVSDKDAYKRVFDWAGRPPADGRDPSLETMLNTVANAEVDLLIESENHYFIFIEAKRAKPNWRNKKEEPHQLVRQFVQGHLLANQIDKTFMLATLGASEKDFIQVKRNKRDKRLLDLKVVGQRDQDLFPDRVPNFRWNLLSPKTD